MECIEYTLHALHKRARAGREGGLSEPRARLVNYTRANSANSLTKSSCGARMTPYEQVEFIDFQNWASGTPTEDLSRTGPGFPHGPSSRSHASGQTEDPARRGADQVRDHWSRRILSARARRLLLAGWDLARSRVSTQQCKDLRFHQSP